MLACMHVCVCAHTHMPECTTGYEMDETKSLKYQAEQGVTVEPIIQVTSVLVMDREAWHAAVYGVSKSSTRLSN